MSPSINVQQAIRAALDYVNQFQNLIPTAEMRLEEVESDDETGEWIITLSFLENQLTGHRAFKTFRVNGVTGQVNSMKIRNPLVRP